MNAPFKMQDQSGQTGQADKQRFQATVYLLYVFNITQEMQNE